MRVAVVTAGAVNLAQQVACVRREIAMRESCYPRWVGLGKMRQPVADHELAAMRAVLVTLESMQPKGDAHV